MKVTVDNLGKAISDILDEYAEEMMLTVDEVTQTVAKKGVQALRSASSVFKGKRYRSGWTVKTEKTRHSTTCKIWNQAVPGLPHLLEHGFAKRTGGRWEGRTHIAPVEDELNRLYENEIKVRISQ